ncbi:hypothetical protein D3C83_231300 [compost metagenome]
MRDSRETVLHIPGLGQFAPAEATRALALDTAAETLGGGIAGFPFHLAVAQVIDTT